VKKGYVANIESRSTENRDFRRVVYTGAHLQLVLMSLEPGEEIGLEVHADTDQFFRIEAGNGSVSIDGHETSVEANTGIVVPAGARHNVKNTGATPMKLYTIYAPPHHQDGIVMPSKADASRSEEHFAGKTTE
jgi:mannose-6-phosphate isomerase-like protein (cupin superfamily)